jgi:hypothetical protein
MASLSKETIVSFNLNASGSGGDHSVSIESVKNAKDLAQDGNDLGAIIGSSAGRTTLSNEKLQKIITNYQLVRETTKKDSKSTRVFREYTHITSLMLKSHCFVVRGSQCHPNDSGSGEVILPYFGECSNSPITLGSQLYPYKPPRRLGGVVAIGNIYNEESSVTSTGVKTSLTYQNKQLKENLCFNLDVVNQHYRNFPDFSNYNLRFGYTLNEAIQGLNQCGVNITGLSKSDDILFEESGTLDAIISNIASKFGYYWFVDPFTYGTVRFVNSASASAIPVTNPLKQSEATQKKYVSASFTQESLSPVIVNAFSANIEKQEQTFEFSQGARLTRFRKLSVKKLADNMDISGNVLKLYYTMYLAGAYTAENFDVMGIIATKNNPKITWKDEEWAGYKSISGAAEGGISLLTSIGENQDVLDELGSLNLKSAKFIKLKSTDGTGTKIRRPSSGTAFPKVEFIYKLLHNKIYLSNYYREYSAKRINWAGSEMNISGPFDINTNISDIEALADIHAALDEDITLEKLMVFAGSKGDGSYGFVGVLDGRNHASIGISKDNLDFDLFNDRNYDFPSNIAAEFLAISNELKSKVKMLANESAKAFNNMDKDASGSQTARAYYTRSQRPTDEAEGLKSREDEEAEADRQAGLDANAQRIAELAERFDIRYYSLNTNGANGSPLNPITLYAKNGKIAEIKALQNSSISSRMSNRYPPSQSSRTIVGLSIPEVFSPTISGITLQLSDSGVTTTIKESTVKMLRPEEQLIIDANMKALLSTRTNSAFTARQKDFFGL